MIFDKVRHVVIAMVVGSDHETAESCCCYGDWGRVVWSSLVRLIMGVVVRVRRV